MSLTLAVQDAVVRLGQDLAGRNSWNLGTAVWAANAHDDGTVSLEKLGGEEFWSVPIQLLIERLGPPVAAHCGFVVHFETWADEERTIDCRYIIAALTNRSCIVLEHRSDRAKARVTIDDGKGPPIGIASVCAHMRSRVCATTPSGIPQELVGLLQLLGIDPEAIIVLPFDLG